ncbi:hypothetical protein K3N28_11320 [Glycomyces sp. TRM65418]|uniref:hypothetical protein n=1 Tax=Glycomyces sp. TRM65418 TaxID=2867006 RepID=UPI001CE4F4E7|nr:hypothetical protein [Glycomyces sp. TRM65418]MCC3763660.1 hypothetical protein [Glycomyces sp. TRM65418]QZD57642.1 hypothetical protein K3N28_11260 [Glycomyces sp. TRM65418]
MTIDPDDEKVAAAFARLKAESSAHFPPPPVNELLGRGPAALRRRRLMSLAAVVGACTAVTAGGFAVAQTLGPLSGGPDTAASSSAASETAEPDGDGPTRLGDPASPHVDETDDETATAAPDGEPVIVIEPADWWEGSPDAWAVHCETGPQPFDAADWKIGDESPWDIVDPAADPAVADTGYAHDYDAPLDLDADGDADDVLLELGCDKRATGIAAFTWDETGTSLHMLGWVWEPGDAGATVDIQLVENGVITLGGYAQHPETWQTRFTWDGEGFAPVEDDVAPADPTPTESTSSPAPPVETPTAEGATSTASGES